MECIFCKIIKKELKSDIVFENDDILAFRDISPQAPVHLLIIPKRHIQDLNEASEQDSKLLADILMVARELAIKEGINESGYRLNLNVGQDAGQAVAHIHFHLLGGRKFTWPPG